MARTHSQHRCTRCALAEVLCICGHLRAGPDPLRTRLRVLMHVAETRTSTNTGRLATRLVPEGEVWLRGERERPSRDLSSASGNGFRLALFPLEGARVLTAGLGEELRARYREFDLVVPDGTWRQASKAVRREILPWLSASPGDAGMLVCLPKETLDISRYGLRVAPREETVCTLDAIGRALEVLEGGVTGRALRNRFDHVLELFVERTLWSRGRRATADLKHPLPPGAESWRSGGSS